MTLGIISAVLLLLVCMKFVKKRISKKNTSAMLKLHKLLGIIFAIVVLIHMITGFKLMKQRPVTMYILGIAMVALALLSLISYFYRKKLGTKWMILHRTAALLLLVCMVLHAIIGIGSLTSYKKAVAEITVNNVDTSNIEDGIYTGEYDVGYIYAKVNVTVKDGKIDDIELLEHRTERGQAAESIPAAIVNKQSIQVDAVTSATNSSKVIMKAVGNALEGR